MKKTITNYSFALFSVLILLASCGNNAKLKLTSYIRYMADEKSFQSDLSIFETKDTTKSIKVEDLFFNGGAMEKRTNKVQGIAYHTERNGSFPNDFFYKFQYNKKNYEQKLNISPINDLIVVDSIAKKTDGITLYWNGRPLERNETLTILITDEDGVSAESTIQGATQSNKATVPGTMFSGLKSGKGTIFVVKRANQILDSETLIVDSAVEFYSKSINLKIID